MKGKITTIIVTLIILGLIGLFVWKIATAPKLSKEEIIARNGLHWHSELHIIIKGGEEIIPAEIGLGAIHLPMHTHGLDNIIHMEFSGLVKQEDLRLAKFFEIWDKQFNSNCIFENCGQLKMLVNGKENAEFENYQMKDGDKIEIVFG